MQFRSVSVHVCAHARTRIIPDSSKINGPFDVQTLKHYISAHTVCLVKVDAKLAVDPTTNLFRQSENGLTSVDFAHTGVH